MVGLKIRHIGNSLGVVIPKQILAQFNITDGDYLFLSAAPDGSMRITPYDPDFEKQMKVAQEGMSSYRNTLRELAK